MVGRYQGWYDVERQTTVVATQNCQSSDISFKIQASTLLSELMAGLDSTSALDVGTKN